MPLYVKESRLTNGAVIGRFRNRIAEDLRDVAREAAEDCLLVSSFSACCTIQALKSSSSMKSSSSVISVVTLRPRAPDSTSRRVVLVASSTSLLSTLEGLGELEEDSVKVTGFLGDKTCGGKRQVGDTKYVGSVAWDDRLSMFGI